MAENMGKKLLPPNFPEQLVEEVGKQLGKKANNVTFFTGEYQADSMIGNGNDNRIDVVQGVVHIFSVVVGLRKHHG